MGSDTTQKNSLRKSSFLTCLMASFALFTIFAVFYTSINNNNGPHDEKEPSVNLRNVRHKYHTIDIGIICSCLEEKFNLFRKRHHRGFGRIKGVRFLIINYGCSYEYPLFIGNIPLIVGQASSDFSRSSNINNLASLSTGNHIFAPVDIDMEIRENFLERVNEFVAPFKAYFPIVWSKYSPESVELIYKTYNKNYWEFSNYAGVWREYGYGMFAMHIQDFVRFRMDESFKGWGGEDNNFFKRVSADKQMHIVREKERGLIHNWHSKDCKNLVSDPNELIACLGSRASYAASSLGWMLMYNKLQQDIFVHPNILIVIPTSLNTKERVESILKTWYSNLPSNIEVIFFTSAAACGYFRNEYPEEEFLCGNVDDNEYPPVYRNVEMLNMVHKSGKMFDWIFKVDDDTYVNILNLETIIYAFRNAKHAFLGSRGFGRPSDKSKLDLKKPYCMGGPGYLIKRLTFELVVDKLNSCVAETSVNENKQYLWHSDIIISKCVEKYTGLGCWDYESVGNVFIQYSSEIFKQHYTNTRPIYNSVTYHSLKTLNAMSKYHINVLEER